MICITDPNIANLWCCVAGIYRFITSRCNKHIRRGNRQNIYIINSDQAVITTFAYQHNMLCVCVHARYFIIGPAYAMSGMHKHISLYVTSELLATSHG